jgi:surface protein
MICFTKHIGLLFTALLCAVSMNVISQGFITTWETNPIANLPGESCNSCITIPTTGGGYNYNIDWDNDGTYDEFGVTGNITHDFGSQGTYTIRISGAFPRIYFNNEGDRHKLESIEQWGNIAWTSMENAFYGCQNIDMNATDNPNLSSVSSLANMFRESNTDFLGNVANWDLSNINDLSYAFSQTRFNQDVSGWNVSNVTNMSGLFSSCGSFNRNLSNWNVRNVTNMSYLFSSCWSFNGDVSTWNVSSVNNMSNLFANCNVFNRNISTWDVSAVTDMSSLFYRCYIFNSNINSWNVSNVENMSAMFMFADAFNQNIGGWNTSKVTDMSAMFAQTDSFDQDISGWDVSQVTDMHEMFTRGTVFNHDISSWNVGNVLNMQEMFRASLFNQDIREWDTRKVTNMSAMFNGSAFNQDVGDWPIQSVTDMSLMFDLSDMNLINYDSTLIKWLGQAGGKPEKPGKQDGRTSTKAIQNGVSLGASGLFFCNSSVARTTLMGTHGWIISGDAPNCALPVQLVELNAQQLGSDIRISFSTSSEINSDFFEIHKSTDGENWEVLNFINGAGNSNQILNYSTYDVQPNEGLNYYRIKQVDFDGKHDFSESTSVIFEMNAQDIDPDIYPNPIHNEFGIKGNTFIKKVHVIDGMGREIATLNNSGNSTFSIENLSNGLYYLLLEDQSGTTYNTEILKK